MKAALYLGFVLATFFGTTAVAEEFELVGGAELNHSKRGRGIEIIVATDRLPAIAALPEVSRRLCSEFAAAAVPPVLKQMGAVEPDFISVMIKTGTHIGTYMRVFYQFDNGTCGAFSRLR